MNPAIAKARKYTSLYLDGLAGLTSNTRTNIVDKYSPEEWIRLYDAYLASGWDFTPCLWTEEQRRSAVTLGLVPEWDENEQPIESTKRLPGFGPGVTP